MRKKSNRYARRKYEAERDDAGWLHRNDEFSLCRSVDCSGSDLFLHLTHQVTYSLLRTHRGELSSPGTTGRTATGGDVAGPGYSGHVKDEDTQLIYMQARYYDPEVGRFLSAEPSRSEQQILFNSNAY